MNRRVGAPETGQLRTPPLLDDLLEQTSRTFALNIPLLPEPMRCEVTVAYLLFRVADTLEDAERWDRSRKLDELDRLARFLRDPSEAECAELVAGWKTCPPCEHAGYRRLLGELSAVVRVAGGLAPRAVELIRDHTLRTIEGMASFVSREREGELQLRDVPDLQAYCYAVAGIVGELLTELFLRHLTDPATAGALREDAARFGEALQLVNILKDSAADRRHGRRYLPETVSRAEVFALARDDLAIARRYCARLDGAGAPRGMVAFTTLPVLLAGGTLTRVERDGPGSKLTRPEVGEIIRSLETALRDGGVGALLGAS